MEDALPGSIYSSGVGIQYSPGVRFCRGGFRRSFGRLFITWDRLNIPIMERLGSNWFRFRDRDHGTSLSRFN
jgi:hypothetical protein